MFRFRRLIDPLPVRQDLLFLSGVPLGWRHETDLTVLVLVVVPPDKVLCPLPGLLQAPKAPSGPFGAVFQGPKQRFHKGVGVAHTRSTVRRRNLPFLQFDPQGLGLHGCAVVRMQDRWMRKATLAQPGLLDHVDGQLAGFTWLDLPGPLCQASYQVS